MNIRHFAGGGLSPQETLKVEITTRSDPMKADVATSSGPTPFANALAHFGINLRICWGAKPRISFFR